MSKKVQPNLLGADTNRLEMSQGSWCSNSKISPRNRPTQAHDGVGLWASGKRVRLSRSDRERDGCHSRAVAACVARCLRWSKIPPGMELRRPLARLTIAPNRRIDAMGRREMPGLRSGGGHAVLTMC